MRRLQAEIGTRETSFPLAGSFFQDLLLDGVLQPFLTKGETSGLLRELGGVECIFVSILQSRWVLLGEFHRLRSSHLLALQHQGSKPDGTC